LLKEVPLNSAWYFASSGDSASKPSTTPAKSVDGPIDWTERVLDVDLLLGGTANAQTGCACARVWVTLASTHHAIGGTRLDPRAGRRRGLVSRLDVERIAAAQVALRRQQAHPGAL
jgi:hypothetical protein